MLRRRAESELILQRERHTETYNLHRSLTEAKHTGGGVLVNFSFEAEHQRIVEFLTGTLYQRMSGHGCYVY